MTPEEYYKEVVKLDMDKFDKKAPKFDYYDLLDFADSYHKKQLTLTDVSSMFSAEQMEQAFNDGVEAEQQRCCEFNIENYC